MRRPLSFIPLVALALTATARAQHIVGASDPQQDVVITSEELLDELRASVARGEIRDPSRRSIPFIPPPSSSSSDGGPPPCLSGAHIFPFEDSAGLLLTNYSTGELLDFMADAANALMATHGDNFDFAGYWVNFTPHHKLGTAFYALIENDVLGIGLNLFNNRPSLGLGGDNIEGFIMMWDIRSNFWQPGSGSNADFTRLALAQEFEHRFAMFLPPLLDGRVLQGNDGGCGRSSHWSWRVDGQGSGMEISEWVGSNPAQLTQSFISFNTDIVGGVFSHTDLYLMGYDSPAEMDVGNSELRFMDNSNCSSFYNGPISTFSSADIIASAGVRIPDSTNAQAHFRTGWILLHLPGAPPTANQLAKATAILEQHQIDWSFSTLGKGTMNNQLFDDCNCNDVPDAEDIATGTSLDVNQNGTPDECEAIGTSYCTPAVVNSSGDSAEILALGSELVADNDLLLVAKGMPTNKFGYFLAGLTQGFVPQPPGSQGNLCLGGQIARFAKQIQSSGLSGAFTIQVDLTSIPTAPPHTVLAGETWNFQAWYRDKNPGNTSNFTDAVSVVFK